MNIEALPDKPINQLVLPIAIIALSGILSHTTQFEGVSHVIANGGNGLNKESQIVNNVTAASRDSDTHIGLSSFTTDTNFLRSQPPATRNREDDEKDYTDSDRSVDDPHGSSKDLKSLPN
ncbi:hypothetical protein HGB25_00590 [Candidatus Saccharibacteria bacterium]|nr:hypothetical protein [Candidatus Saccharibacteria bacterium]